MGGAWAADAGGALRLWRESSMRAQNPADELLLSGGLAMTTPKNGLTYADAGVDIDAGNALVDRIKPAANDHQIVRRGAVGGQIGR